MTDINIKKISDLARINISDENLPKMQKDMENILKWLEEAQSVAAKTEPLKNNLAALNFTNMRNDEVHRTISVQDVTSNTKESHENFFVTPKIIEGK